MNRFRTKRVKAIVLLKKLQDKKPDVWYRIFKVRNRFFVGTYEEYMSLKEVREACNSN